MIDDKRLEESPLFSATWYRRWHPSAGSDPVQHYLAHGGRTGADPHPLFATEWYLQRYSESASFPTPLHHFLTVGLDAAVDPHPLFDSAWYRSQRPSLPASMTPVEDYLQRGGDLDPHPLFSTEHYRTRSPRPTDPAGTPLEDYLAWGALRGDSPSPMVDLADLERRLPSTGDLDPLSYVLAKLSLGEVFDLPLWHSSMPAPPPAEEERPEADWKWEYLVEGQWRWPDTFVLARVIGNDLPPRHTRGQTLENVRFTLENEPPLEGCEKSWVVNRIIDRSHERKLLDLLDEFDQDYTVIPFDRDAYRRVGWRFDDFEQPGITMGRYPPGVTEHNVHVAFDHLYHDKNLYVMNNNGARNVGLDEGRSRATWVLPFDGNCFFTEEAWATFRDAVLSQPHLRYFTVPMARVTRNEDLLEPGSAPPANEEPQLAFRWDASERFNEQARYGRRPKVDLFYRLGIPGPWDRWKFHRWEEGRPAPSPEAGRWTEAGWVARLFSGRAELEGDIVDRGLSRIRAIRNCIDALDESFARERYGRDDLVVLDEEVLRTQRDRLSAGDPPVSTVCEMLRTAAEDHLTRDLPSVLDKSTVAPSGDPHDYWHPAPYWWPNPSTPDGLPYIQRDGVRIPGTELGGPGSERYDRTALQHVLDGVFILGLAGYLLDESAYHRHAARMLEVWFLDPATRMNPHLRYAQVRRGHDGDEGQATGVIEFSDIHHVLDAVRLLERSGRFTRGDELGLWFTDYRQWLHTSPQGRKERAAPNNHGTWYDVQDLAISAYLGDLPHVLEVVRRSEERLHEQFDRQGSQPEEATRTTSLHYHTYNLQGFLVLCHMAERVGVDLWQARVGDRRPIEGALRLLLRHRRKPWPLPQTQPFDHDRLLVLAHHARAGYPELVSDLPARGALRLRPVLSAHFGLRPFWQLGLAGLATSTKPTNEKATTR